MAYLISIVNLPPCFRKTKGMGIFTLTAMSVDPVSPVGLFILDLLVQELFLLFDGICVNIGGQMYFLQARLISHVYDTRAYEKVVMVQTAGSYAGCAECKHPG